MGHLSLVPSTSQPLIPNSVFKEVTNKITTRGQLCGGKRRNGAAIFFTSFALHQDDLTKSISLGGPNEITVGFNNGRKEWLQKK